MYGSYVFRTKNDFLPIKSTHCLNYLSDSFSILPLIKIIASSALPDNTTVPFGSFNPYSVSNTNIRIT